MALCQERSEAVPAHDVVDRVEAEMSELGNHLFDLVGLRDEELSERAWIHEPELTGLGEGDHHMCVLGQRLLRRLHPQELSTHAEMYDKDVLVLIERDEKVFPASADRYDLAALQPGRELVGVFVAADRPVAGNLHGLDPLGDDLLFQVAP